MAIPFPKQAFLIITNEAGKATIDLYYKLQAATLQLGDVYLLVDTPTALKKEPTGVNIHYFSNKILTTLGVKPIADSILPGSNHFTLFDFFNKYPDYDYYWSIENDVAFNGDWNDFFSSITNITSDFITSHLRKYSKQPHWHWWNTLNAPIQHFTEDNLFRSFNPIYRISVNALKHVYASQKAGLTGHHEVLLPSLLKKDGFIISDLGDKKNEITSVLSFCTLKTMRWKPIFLFPGTRKNKLYHPVKPNVTFKQIVVFIKRSLLNETTYI